MLPQELLQLLQQVLVTDSLPSWVRITLPVGVAERIYDR